ncbi:MAG: hypothetical protein IKC73_04255 [Clostridia bacterium]|nr:hypothetical protein [Clostridia bacterium]
MPFDKKQMSALLGKSDSELWKIITAVAATSGIALPEAQPSARDMARLRTVLAGVGERDVGEALAILRRARGED